MFLDLGPTRFDITHRALVMGILNRTPDSFYDQGAYYAFEDFLRKAEQLVTDGADFLDVGGVKAGPGDEVSEEEELATTTLTRCWLLWGGGYDVGLLGLREDQWPERCVRVMAAIKVAGSMNVERFLELTATMPGRPSMTPRPANAKVAERRRIRAAAFVAAISPEESLPRDEAARFWVSFDSACRQGLRTDALWLLQTAPLSSDALWSALTVAARGPGTPEAIALLRAKSTMTDQLLFLAATTLLLCTPTAERILNNEMRAFHEKRNWVRWTENTGRRSARIHAIPREALHSETTRGKIPSKYTNILDIREPMYLLHAGCAFWRRVLVEHGIIYEAESDTLLFPSDEATEAFYDYYFPDDIPDEWSSQDQEKSHGRGCERGVAPPSELRIREEPVKQREWNCAIHVR